MTREILDPDGNIIRKGMMVVSGGDTWVVGCVGMLSRLDRVLPDGKRESRLIGRKRLRLVHVVGFQVPLIFT